MENNETLETKKILDTLIVLGTAYCEITNNSKFQIQQDKDSLFVQATIIKKQAKSILETFTKSKEIKVILFYVNQEKSDCCYDLKNLVSLNPLQINKNIKTIKACDFIIDVYKEYAQERQSNVIRMV